MKGKKAEYLDKVKYGVLKGLDIAGLTFLDPVIRLIYGEEPRVQVKKIGQFIVIPVIAFAIFIALWNNMAPKHKTKSGEVPTPGVVQKAADGVWTFHERETIKSSDFMLEGEAREAALEEAKLRLLEVEGLVAKAGDDVKAADAERSRLTAEVRAPNEAELDAIVAKNKASKAERNAELKALVEKADAAGEEGREAYLTALRRDRLILSEEKEAVKLVKAKIDEASRLKYQPLIDARFNLKIVAEEKQFLGKRIEYLSKNNRSMKVGKYQETLAGLRSDFATASGKDLEKLGSKIVREEERIERVGNSEYAQPWTFPRQISRSLRCVFLGFVIASAIAIPIGVLCGLSSVFMAAMMPFIALFKPVSPIVWLPIALIVVGGFIPDPDKHWFIDTVNSMPLLSNFDINPAFIASAITVALCSLWPTLVNTAFGVASIDKDHVNVARVLRLGFWSRLFKIVIPSALPLIFAGLRISLGVGWMVLIAAELLSSSEGIGKFVWDMFNNGSSDSFAQMFVVVFVVGIIGMVLDRIMIVFQRLVSFDEGPASI